MIPLNADSISSSLDFPASVEVFDEIDSSNAYLKRHFSEFSSSEPSLVVADSQSGGYGKFGRVFFSPSDSGVYFSVLLPVELVEDVSLLTLAAGVCVCRALSGMISGRDFSLKWVNDILVDGLKCGGILAESVVDDSGRMRFVVLGIGVNFSVDAFPDELAGIAGHSGAGASFDRNVFVASVLNSLVPLLQKADSIVPAFRQLCSTFGQRVEVVAGNRRVVGQAVDVDDSGALVVIDDKKNRHLFNSGEVSKIFI